MAANTSRLKLGRLFFSLLICQSSFNSDANEMAPTAPFINDLEIRRFSDELINAIAKTDIHAAAQYARANSHLDDDITQKNLTGVFENLALALENQGDFAIKFVQESRFGRSFIRHQYALKNAHLTLRCMLTYRRKAAGWRLNQLWCANH